MRILILLPVVLFTVSSAGSFVEDENLWSEIDSYNSVLENGETLGSEQLQQFFQSVLETALSQRFQSQIELLREDAFQSGDYSLADSYIDRAAPAIIVVMAGESNNIGVDPGMFLTIAEPGTGAYDFLDLASDGFYYSAESNILGTAELPMWMEFTGSSAQARVVPELAEAYLSIWHAFRTGFRGYFGYLADQTIQGLGGESVVSSEVLQEYYMLYEDPAVQHVRIALNSFLNGSSVGISSAGSVLEDLETNRSYLGDRFVVLSVEGASMGGYTILLMSQQKPDRIFSAWVYQLSSLEYELRGFKVSDMFPADEVAEIAEMFSEFLEDQEHSL